MIVYATDPQGEPPYRADGYSGDHNDRYYDREWPRMEYRSVDSLARIQGAYHSIHLGYTAVDAVLQS